MRTWRLRKLLPLLASYLFYAAWNPPFVVLLWISTIVDWNAAHRIAVAHTAGRKRFWLVVSLVCNLGMLAVFKYGNFVLANFNWLFQSSPAEHPVLDIVLPVGISFYTFQTLSYTIDVYRGQLKPGKSLSDFALFVTFFPQLVAGPIVRAVDFMPQLENERKPGATQIGWGLVLALIGVFQKSVLADYFLAPVVESVYATSLTPDFVSAWTGTLAFAGQIFFDFSGYSLCAIGIAMCFGFGLPDNFRSPYGALGLSDFWKRWHISLSSWLRDYLYIPLGGNRTGFTSVNLMITMLLGGLWHGAAWTFVVWGALHGAFLIIEHSVVSWIPDRIRKQWPAKLFGGFCTFVAVNVAWVYFRALDFGTANRIVTSMFSGGTRRLVNNEQIIQSGIIIVALVMVHCYMRDKSLETVFDRLPAVGVIFLFAAMLLSLLLFRGEDRAFIYFQF